MKTVEGGLNFLKDGSLPHRGTMAFIKDCLFTSGFAPFKMPRIDPYHINSIQAEHSQGNSNFNLKSSLNDAQISGLVSTTKITRVASKFGKKFAMKVEALCDKIELSGGYTMNGQIVVLPIKGVGKANVSMSDVTALIDFRGDFLDKNGETFINLTSFKIKLTPKHTYFFFENIFNGDPVLSETINSFMNDNMELLTEALIPGYEEKLGGEFKIIANKIFQNVPMKLIFPE